jgi:hypothetical protein
MTHDLMAWPFFSPHLQVEFPNPSLDVLFATYNNTLNHAKHATHSSSDDDNDRWRQTAMAKRLYRWRFDLRLNNNPHTVVDFRTNTKNIRGWLSRLDWRQRIRNRRDRRQQQWQHQQQQQQEQGLLQCKRCRTHSLNDTGITWLREHKFDGVESSYYGIIMVETGIIHTNQHPIHTGMVSVVDGNDDDDDPHNDGLCFFNWTLLCDLFTASIEIRGVTSDTTVLYKETTVSLQQNC